MKSVCLKQKEQIQRKCFSRKFPFALVPMIIITERGGACGGCVKPNPSRNDDVRTSPKSSFLPGSEQKRVRSYWRNLDSEPLTPDSSLVSSFYPALLNDLCAIKFTSY